MTDATPDKETEVDEKRVSVTALGSPVGHAKSRPLSPDLNFALEMGLFVVPYDDAGKVYKGFISPRTPEENSRSSQEGMQFQPSPDKVRDYWERYPVAQWIVECEESLLAVLEVRGNAGEKALKDLEERHNKLHTLRSTHVEGSRIYFRCL